MKGCPGARPISSGIVTLGRALSSPLFSLFPFIFLSSFLSFKVNSTLDMGLELTTPRPTVACSTNGALRKQTHLPHRVAWE